MRCLIAQNCTGGLAMVDGIPVFMKEDLLPIMGDERMIQELPEQFTRRIQ